MPVREPIVLKEDIKQLKRETDTAILAHNYMDPDIIEISDIHGDSLTLAMAAMNVRQKNILVCAVRFMAETAAVLAPDKNVILSHTQAVCPMTNQVSAARIRMYKEENPDVCVMACMNASLEVKAEADICVTAANAPEVAAAVRQKKILIVPDSSLGEYVRRRVPKKEIEVWNGGCPVLRSAEKSDITLAREKWPGIPVAVNSQCRDELCEAADFSGSTAQILKYCEKMPHEVIICDETSVHARLHRNYPERFFRQLAPTKLICNSMRLTTLEVVEKAIKGEAGESVVIPFDVADAARRPIEAMLSRVPVKND